MKSRFEYSWINLYTLHLPALAFYPSPLSRKTAKAKPTKLYTPQGFYFVCPPKKWKQTKGFNNKIIDFTLSETYSKFAAKIKKEQISLGGFDAGK